MSLPQTWSLKRTCRSHRNQRVAFRNRFLRRGGGSRAVARRPAAFVSQATNGGEWRSWKSKRWLIHGLPCLAGWVWTCAPMCMRMCLCPAGHTVDDRLARPRMGQAPSAPQAAVMCPFSHHSPRPTRPKLSLWLCVWEAVFCCLFPSYGCVVSKSEPQSLYLPNTIKVEVCLGFAVAEQLTLETRSQGHSSWLCECSSLCVHVRACVSMCVSVGRRSGLFQPTFVYNCLHTVSVYKCLNIHIRGLNKII